MHYTDVFRDTETASNLPKVVEKEKDTHPIDRCRNLIRFTVQSYNHCFVCYNRHVGKGSDNLSNCTMFFHSSKLQT